MKISFKIDYRTSWGQTICICGSLSQLGGWKENRALRLDCVNSSEWSTEIEISGTEPFEYYYLVKDGNAIVRKEWGLPRVIKPENGKSSYIINDYWREIPAQQFLYTSAFSDSYFSQAKCKGIKFYSRTLLFDVNCPYVQKGQEVIVCGESDLLGNWNPAKALRLKPFSSREWKETVDFSAIRIPLQYKLAIYDNFTKQVLHWEYGENRVLNPLETEPGSVFINKSDYRYGWLNWKGAGVAIPVFSLRSKDSFGVGEFPDLNKMVDWAVRTGQKVIQVLPVNDTTITHKWTDSYPYNSISIYALHPIYLGLAQFPLPDSVKMKSYLQEAEKLNNLEALDYEKVTDLKWRYLRDLFAETGKKVLKNKGFKVFFETNKDWLFPYACFCCLRDKYHTADYSAWEEFEKYDRKKLDAFIASDHQVKETVELLYFIQYLLHVQLSAVKAYANSKGVILKGDIPIGISRNSVEAWVEPHLFNMDTQTGAPPDDFSVNGQNWGFPTYNWEEMAKDNYQWWAKRFRKMSDYFDAYRIDHILGFFRIWEIPLDSVQGLLGYFSPALPFTADEIRTNGMWFDEYRMTSPYIHEHFLQQFFGEYAQEVTDKYLQPVSWQRYELKEFCNTQFKIRQLFEGKTDVKSVRIKNGLFGLCNEVLFIKDKKEPYKYHPRITAQYTYSYRDLDEATKQAFNRLYDHFFYHRHSQFWKEQALKKLPTLIASTQMLVCGEDLGMIPDCVPEVMKQLQILSLEVQRMPKDSGRLFEDLNMIPYMSVCTTSTHDMSPIRAWWNENKDMTQRYYNEILWKPGIAPEECTPEICTQILKLHLGSPAMLVILPLQDWLSMDGKIRKSDAESERINIPAEPRHYWKYRMHLNLEELLESNAFNERVLSLVQAAGR